MTKRGVGETWGRLWEEISPHIHLPCRKLWVHVHVDLATAGHVGSLKPVVTDKGDITVCSITYWPAWRSLSKINKVVPCYPRTPDLCVAQFLTAHKVASVLEDPTSQSLHGQSQDFFGFAPAAVFGICLTAPSWIRKYALLAARSTVSSPHIRPKTHFFSSSLNKALLFWSVIKGWLLFFNYWSVPRSSRPSAPLSSSAPRCQASCLWLDRGSICLIPTCMSR